MLTLFYKQREIWRKWVSWESWVPRYDKKKEEKRTSCVWEIKFWLHDFRLLSSARRTPIFCFSRCKIKKNDFTSRVGSNEFWRKLEKSFSTWSIKIRKDSAYEWLRVGITKRNIFWRHMCSIRSSKIHEYFFYLVEYIRLCDLFARKIDFIRKIPTRNYLDKRIWKCIWNSSV